MASSKLPVLFVGHGSPMNAVETNDYTEALARLGRSLPRPSTILAISAHWMTHGFRVTSMERPRTIHDFHGFPRELFEIQYPASGSPGLAASMRDALQGFAIELDTQDWGLDHGTWSVLRHLYPQADIPVVQLSIDLGQSPETHYRLGQGLRKLREAGVLILGSGNIVHNLRRISWETDAPVMPWAAAFDQWSKEKLLARDHQALVSRFHESEEGRLAIPTLDHYLPLLVALGASLPEEELSFIFEGIQNASIAMRSVIFG